MIQLITCGAGKVQSWGPSRAQHRSSERVATQDPISHSLTQPPLSLPSPTHLATKPPSPSPPSLTQHLQQLHVLPQLLKEVRLNQLGKLRVLKVVLCHGGALRTGSPRLLALVEHHLQSSGFRNRGSCSGLCGLELIDDLSLTAHDHQSITGPKFVSSFPPASSSPLTQLFHPAPSPPLP